MLYDKEFLLKLDKSKNKTIYARVTALKFDESPVETIEGRVTQGSINIDGASAVRRTCSLSIVAQNFNYNDYYWGLNTKFKLEIGVQNLVDSFYPDIIWFNQGIYLITGFNTSRSTNNFTISINGKDKMCLLNGEVSGSFESSIDFGQIEEESADGIWEIRKIPIPEIIRNMVHTYGGEPYWNIIINDLDTYGLELLEYRYDTPMFLYRQYKNNLYDNVVLGGENRQCEVYSVENGEPKNKERETTLDQLKNIELELLVDSLTGVASPKLIKMDNDFYYVAKVEYGQTAGYRATDLVYAGDLLANVGENVVSVLDKIKNMLVEFEYFYDLDGHFVFQKKKSFTSTLWSPLGVDENGDPAVIENLMNATATAYTFSGGELITGFNNNPNLLNLRNDYSIWGERVGVSGANIPIHLRYAIDLKPTSYTQIYIEEGNPDIIAYNEKYGTTLKCQPDPKTFSVEDGWDWREIIYQMALDYYRYNHLDDFEIRLIRANPQYQTGQTGYESYYIDLQGFWRQLYDPTLLEEIEKYESDYNILMSDKNTEYSLEWWKELISLTEKYIIECNNILYEENGQEGANYEETYNDLVEYQQKLPIYRNKLVFEEARAESLATRIEDLKDNLYNYYYYSYKEDGSIEGEIPNTNAKKYWNRAVYESPETINFWFDFLDSERGDLAQFSVKTVGSRSKSINDTNVKSIYFRETPSVIFTDDFNSEDQIPSYRYIQVPDYDIMFSISAQGKSAKSRLDELIYQHGYCIESATINAIPVYYLEPNTRIRLYDKDTGLDGEYVVSKITLPLAYNGTMNITATKAAESLY